MAKQNNVQVVEKNAGTKIAFVQDGTRLYFGDDDIMINAAKYQKDWPVQVDICADDNRNLVVGVGAGRYYVAQVDIPAITYTEIEAEAATEDTPVAVDASDTEGTHGTMENHGVQYEPQPINMSDVVVTLWSVDDIIPANR